MAYKMKIPEAWIRQRPNAARLPHVYNLDAAVGIGCQNLLSDVMLVQVMLLAWKTGPSEFGAGTKDRTFSIELGALPANGYFDNRLLAWILHYQLKFWRTEIAMITGKVVPATASSPLDGRHVLLHMNLQLIDPNHLGELNARTPWTKLWLDMAAAPEVPGALSAAVRDAR